MCSAAVQLESEGVSPTVHSPVPEYPGTIRQHRGEQGLKNYRVERRTRAEPGATHPSLNAVGPSTNGNAQGGDRLDEAA